MDALKALVFVGFWLLGPAVAWSQGASQLVGKYQMEMDSSETLELRADGTATLGDDETQWSVRGNQLVVGADVMPYVYVAGRLIMVVGPTQIAWRKLGAQASKAAPTPMAAPKTQAASPAGAGNARDAQYRQVLMNSAWCSFTYNKVSGTSTTRRVVFRPDGVMTTNGGAETYSAGSGGTYAGQSSQSNAVLWKYEGLRLYLDDGRGAGFRDAGLSATTNSNGSIILMAAGREYSMCR